MPWNPQDPDESEPDRPPLTARERALLEEIRSGEAGAKLARAAAEDVTGVKPVARPDR